MVKLGIFLIAFAATCMVAEAQEFFEVNGTTYFVDKNGLKYKVTMVNYTELVRVNTTSTVSVTKKPSTKPPSNTTKAPTNTTKRPATTAPSNTTKAPAKPKSTTSQPDNATVDGDYVIINGHKYINEEHSKLVFELIPGEDGGAGTDSNGANQDGSGTEPGTDTTNPNTDTPDLGTDTSGSGTDTANPGTDATGPGTDSAGPGTSATDGNTNETNSGTLTTNATKSEANPGANPDPNENPYYVNITVNNNIFDQYYEFVEELESQPHDELEPQPHDELEPLLHDELESPHHAKLPNGTLVDCNKVNIFATYYSICLASGVTSVALGAVGVQPVYKHELNPFDWLLKKPLLK